MLARRSRPRLAGRRLAQRTLLPSSGLPHRSGVERRAVELNRYALAIHGGAGALSGAHVSAERLVEMQRGLTRALDAGVTVLAGGGSALDAVVEAVAVLEDSPVFNAGRGAVLRSDGSVRLDAAVMLGQEQRTGAVCLVQTVQNPVELARRVMARGRAVMLAGVDAEEFAREEGMVTQPPEYFITDYRRQQLARLQATSGQSALDHDVALVSSAADVRDEGQTVGAVALDVTGHLAAATSTGGMTNARPGRVGDSPIVGAGTWAADGVCAVSATGAGEYFIRSAFAHSVYARMAWAGEELTVATREALDSVLRIGGEGGCVAIDAMGNVAMPFTTLAMPRACQLRSGERRVCVLEGQTVEPA